MENSSPCAGVVAAGESQICPVLACFAATEFGRTAEHDMFQRSINTHRHGTFPFISPPIFACSFFLGDRFYCQCNCAAVYMAQFRRRLHSSGTRVTFCNIIRFSLWQYNTQLSSLLGLQLVIDKSFTSFVYSAWRKAPWVSPGNCSNSC